MGDLEGHLHRHCPKVQFFCKHGLCVFAATRGEIGTHEEECGETPVVCACGASLKRKLLKEHLQSICPAQPTTRMYCGETGVLRREMETHLDSCAGTITVAAFRKEFRELRA